MKYLLVILFAFICFSTQAQEKEKLDSLQKEIYKLKAQLKAAEKVNYTKAQLIKENDSLSLSNDFLQTEVLLLKNKLENKEVIRDTIYLTKEEEEKGIEEGYYIVVCSHRSPDHKERCDYLKRVNGITIQHKEGGFYHSCVPKALKKAQVQPELRKARLEVNKEAWWIYVKK